VDTVAVRGNLPHHLSSFVDREADLRSLKGVLGSARMVTLVGTGGAGKSRLAAELARANLGQWPDGAWWVELEAATDVPGAVLATLELPGRGLALDVVASWLAGKKALLVLDNCEQLVAECAAFGQAALARCPRLTIIATSREALGVSGEVRWPVSSLPEADAVQLFEVRARLVAPNFKAAPATQGSVARICERLDGLPLAIEMAAARLDVMSEHELLSNLNDRFQLLTSGTRHVPQRQQTMLAAIDWSHRLLTEDEARLFRRLAVFQGGFTLEAVQAVCADAESGTVLALLTGLVQKSMVVADRQEDGRTRYRLLESNHVYAAGKLLESDELGTLQGRHYAYYMAALQSRDIADQRWKARESANLWAALAWARENVEDMGLALALEVADFDFTDLSRARALLLDLLEHSQAKGAPRARALDLAARLAMRQADHASARHLADAGVQEAREVGDSDLIARALRGAGGVYHAAGDLDAAAGMYEEALRHLEGSEDRRFVFEVKNHLGVLATERGQYREGLDILIGVVAFSRSTRDELGTAHHVESLANAQLGLGDLDASAASWRESLVAYRDFNDAWGTIWCFGGLALVAEARGDDERALRLAAVADRMSREWSLSAWPLRVSQLDAAAARARTRLSARKSEGAWNDGQTMSTARALDYALAEDKQQVEASPQLALLSRREREVVALVAAGMTSKQIADRLFIAERTAEGHVERIRNKLGVRSRTEVATWAVEHGVAGSLDKNPPASKV
jgi:non-specific serine/threonine protein kinase